MSRQALSTATGVPQLPRRTVGRALLRLRVRMRRRALDEALADGRDPWSSPMLVTRAAQLASFPHRQQLADALDALVEIAEYRRRPSSCLAVRAPAILREREVIAALAQRLRDPAPVDVGVVARLGVLVWDELSPVFVHGRPVETLARTLELCEPALVD